jgi:hypothetical protein
MRGLITCFPHLGFFHLVLNAAHVLANPIHGESSVDPTKTYFIHDYVPRSAFVPPLTALLGW